jgi:hypothetical protein
MYEDWARERVAALLARLKRQAADELRQEAARALMAARAIRRGL